MVRYEDVLARIDGRARAHIDLKFTSPDEAYADPGSTHEVAAVRRALEVLGTGYLLVTTNEDKAVRAVRDWADAEGHELLVGLSLGRSVRGLPWWKQVQVRVSELLPQAALPGVEGQPRGRQARPGPARRRGASPGAGTCRWWCGRSTPRTRSATGCAQAGRWLVTTNQPGLALKVRSGVSR